MNKRRRYQAKRRRLIHRRCDDIRARYGWRRRAAPFQWPFIYQMQYSTRLWAPEGR
jgi:hypothetical protein